MTAAFQLPIWPSSGESPFSGERRRDPCPARPLLSAASSSPSRCPTSAASFPLADRTRRRPEATITITRHKVIAHLQILHCCLTSAASFPLAACPTVLANDPQQKIRDAT